MRNNGEADADDRKEKSPQQPSEISPQNCNMDKGNFFIFFMPSNFTRIAWGTPHLLRSFELLRS